MQRFSTSAAILEHELSELRLIVERQAGVLLDASSQDLAQVVTQYLESQHLASVKDLLELLRSSASACENLIGPLLDGETCFFRHPAAFDSLTRLALPEILARKSSESPRTLRIWSAGCSTGEEPYSIAISVCETVNCNGGGWNVHIVASDIRRKRLELAERGLYQESALAHVPSHLVRQYFVKVGEHFIVKPRVRNLVRFAPMNLAQPVYIGRFDCIFCMDVLPYFSMSQRMALAQRLHCYLQPGGYLFLAQGEKLPAVGVTFNWQKNGEYLLYQKPMAAAAKSGT
ncbi:MAG: protein-glutamate O-methyltransferase CheR [Acidobacteriia bacterium]|nr:protein-glutamate O-methyltransferase CheR [Terriglobia bacterium]